MDMVNVVAIGQEALLISILIAGPVLVVVLLVGLVLGILQAATQVQEQTVPTVMKLGVTVGVLILTLPWMAEELVRFTTAAIRLVAWV